MSNVLLEHPDEDDSDEELANRPERYDHDPYECEYEHCPTCRQHWMDEKADQQTRKE